MPVITATAGDPSVHPALSWRADRTAWTLPAILVAALVLRIGCALLPYFPYPDELYQYLEPAYRLTHGTGVVSWEYRLGMRSWLLPGLAALPLAIGDMLAPNGLLDLFLPRIVAAVASLSVVWSGWRLGARLSPGHAIIGALVAATWVDLVAFAPLVLSESLAVTLALPGAVLLTEADARPQTLVAAGALVGLGALLRFQYAPALAVLVLLAVVRHRERLAPVIIGGLLALGVQAIVDIAAGGVPLGWVVANVDANLVAGRADGFGVFPPTHYLSLLARFWGIWLAPIVVLAWIGRRASPALWWAALTNIVIHSLIGHKEWRFIFLSVAILTLLAAIGSVEVLVRTRKRWPQFGLAPLAAAWIGLSLTLAVAPAMRTEIWSRGDEGVRLARALRGDAATCGVALFGIAFFTLPGHAALPDGVQLYMYDGDDPVMRQHDQRRWLAAGRAAFDRIVTVERFAHAIPASYAPTHCQGWGSDRLCVYARPGDCLAAAAARPMAINSVLIRTDR